MREIEFEGRIVEVPDDATDDEVARIIQGTASSTTQPQGSGVVGAVRGAVADAKAVVSGDRQEQPASPDRSLVDKIMGGASYAMGVADQGARGIADGALNIAGLPVDAANALLGLVGLGSDQPFMGSKSLKNSVNAWNNLTADTIGAERPRAEPDNLAERFTHRVGEEVGAMAVPAAGIVGKASQVGVQGARQMSPLARAFVEPAAVNPGRFINQETAAAVGAGTGAAIANEATRAAGYKDGSTGHLVGDLAGALTGGLSVGVARHVGNKAGEVLNAMRGAPDYTDQVVRDTVTDQIAEAAGLRPTQPGAPVDTAPLADSIEGGRRVGDTIPGFQESMADRTKNPGVAALEYSRQSGPNSGMFTQRRAENTQAIDNAMARSEPQGNPGALRSELELERDRRLTDAGVQAQNAQDAFDKTAQGLRAGMAGEARGADIRAALEDAHTRVKDAVSALYKPINESAAKVDVTPLAKEFGSISDNLSTAEARRFQPSEAGIPGEFVQPAKPPVDTGVLDASGKPIMREPPAGDATQPLREVTGIRSALTDQAREAASAGRANEARIINQYIDALDGYVEQAIPAELKGQWSAARTARRDQADRFERPQTAIAQTLDRREGLYAQPDSAVAGKFVQSDEGRIADFEALMREAGSDARVRGAVRDQILADVGQRGLLDKPEALDTYLNQYGRVFGQFPDLKKELGTAGSLRRQLADAQGAQSDLMREIGPQGRGVVAKYLQYGDENAEKAMSAVMRAKEPGKAVDELLSFVGDDPKAIEGARKVFWNLMQKTARRAGETTADISGAQPWMPKALQRFIDDPGSAAVAERLYRDNPEHWQNVKQIAEAIQGVDLRNSAKAANSSGTAQGMSAVLSPETLQSRFYAFKRGQISGSFLLTSIGAVAARRSVAKARADAIGRMLDEALLNPDAAAMMLKENNPANRAALARKAKVWLGNEASTFLELVTPESEDDQMKKAIMR
ncbi:MAG: hypothetical protein HYU59_05725 [Magnetospirillum gryphiswaldense]|nr:hypothetical protein [Magnetospirillum gryphiswaldense]